MIAFILKAFSEVQVDLEKKRSKCDFLNYIADALKKICNLQLNSENKVEVDKTEKNCNP